MGRVYAAEDELLRRRVAVKILAERVAGDPALRERFACEAVTTARLGRHPRVVTVYDAGEWEGRPFIVMELAAGGSLADRLNVGPVEPAQALAWLGEAAEALDAAHAEGVIHRDLKPSNLLLDEDGRVLVADFGIARIAGKGSELTPTGGVLGTAGYLAPEQALGQAASPASDRYALAIIAYELLLGSRPSGADCARAPLEAVFARALASEPEQRHPSARAFVEELRSALATPAPTRVRLLPPHTDALPARRGLSEPPARRHRAGEAHRRWIVASLAVAALSALGGGVVGTHVARGTAGAAEASATCTLSPAENDANVVVTGLGASSFCRHQASRLTTEDAYWGYRAGRRLLAPDHGTDELAIVCGFTRRSLDITVYDDGEQEIGGDVCRTYLEAGSRASRLF